MGSEVIVRLTRVTSAIRGIIAPRPTTHVLRDVSGGLLKTMPSICGWVGRW